MNPLLFIASITNNPRIRKFCAIQRNRQLNRKWAKEKATSAKVAVENFELNWDLTN